MTKEPEPTDDTPAARRLKSPNEAAAELHKGFNNWTKGVGKAGIQTAYALVAANWATYGDARQILTNTWARSSMAIIFSFLALHLFLTWIMTRLYASRCRYAAADGRRWREEFERTTGPQGSRSEFSGWPYSRSIELLGVGMRILTVSAPLLAGLLFLLGLFRGAP